MLLTEGLHINESKTERYHIQRGGERRSLKEMQISWITTLHQRRYQKAKRT